MKEAACKPSNSQPNSVPETPIAFTIAGFDPSSGAGITADLKVFTAFGIYGMACITALTVQSTLGVQRVEAVAPATIRETLNCLRDDVLPAGVKVGMLATPEAVGEVASFLAQSGIPRSRVVLDPVLRSSSGWELLSPAGVERLRSELLASVGWVTPNLDELAVLTGSETLNRESIPAAAAKLQGIAATARNSELHVLVTGGHLKRPDDFLLTPDGQGTWLEGEHVETEATHGTGCALSSALLCQLIAGRNPQEAAEEAKRYVTAALKAAYKVGQGRGPMNHFFGMAPK